MPNEDSASEKPTGETFQQTTNDTSEKQADNKLARPPKRGLWLAVLTALAHLALAAFFFFRPANAIDVINAGSKVFKGFDESPVPVDWFWMTFGSFYFLTVGIYLLHGAVSKHSKSSIAITIFIKMLVIAAFGYQFLHQARAVFSTLCGIALESVFILPLLVSLIRLIRQDNQNPSVE